jgi:hypothetical protein
MIICYSNEKICRKKDIPIKYLITFRINAGFKVLYTLTKTTHFVKQKLCSFLIFLAINNWNEKKIQFISLNMVLEVIIFFMVYCFSLLWLKN